MAETREITVLEVLTVLFTRLVFPGIEASVQQNYMQKSLKAILNTPLSAEQAAQATVQNYMTEEEALAEAELAGYNTQRMTTTINVAGEPPGSQTLLELWNRGVLDEEQVTQGLRESRVKNKYIDAIKILRNYLPSPSDVVRFQVREAYRDDIAAKFGTDNEYPERADADFRELGVSPRLARLFWRAHWELPSLGEAYEMLHRGIITSEDIDVLLETQDVMPRWREPLKAISYNPLTRVDVRRMWDLQVVDDSDVIKTYEDQGYTHENALKLLTFTKLERSLPELRRRYRNNWITVDDIRATLRPYGIPEDRLERVIQGIVKNDSAERVAKHHELTKAEIIKGAKKGIIDKAQAVQLLVHLGHTELEAEFILHTELETQGSPETPLQHYVMTCKWRMSVGLPCVDVPQEVLDAEQRYLQLQQKNAPEEEVSGAKYAYNLMLAKHNLQQYAI